MPSTSSGVSLSLSRARLAERLNARREEIEVVALTRAHAVADPDVSPGVEYLRGLRDAVKTAVGYGIEAIGCCEGARPPDPPALLLFQARLAARCGVSLDVVLRRYVAGNALLGDFMIAAAEDDDAFDGSSLKRLMRTQAGHFDRLIVAVSREYTAHANGVPRSAEQRRAALVKRLLAGELVDVAALGYDLDCWHLALVGAGPRAAEAIGDLARALGRCRLSVSSSAGTIWGWIGGQRDIDPTSLRVAIETEVDVSNVALSLGEPGSGPAGWRLSHRQAMAALPIAMRGSGGVVRYSEVALLTSMLQDEVLLASLRQLYLAPLARERDGGEALRTTLRAYFAAGRNVSSTAAALGVHRHTVDSRLRCTEQRIGTPLSSCAAQLEAALEVDGLAPVAGQVVDFPGH